MRPTIILCLTLALGGVWSGCTSIPPGFAASHPWGSVTNGLQMSISIFKTDNRADPEFAVTLQNSGTNDVCLNLGYVLANGQVQLPAKIHLRLVDDAGNIRNLDFADKRYGNVSGRVDDYAVPLRSGSTYTLVVRLNQFWSPAGDEFVIKLKPGSNKVSAELQGEGAEYLNSGMGEMHCMNFWKGKLESNIATVVE